MQQPGAPRPAPSDRTYQATFRTHTGAILWWYESDTQHEGTLEEITAIFWRKQAYCLFAGWWGIASAFVLNPYTLIRNTVVYLKVRRQATGQ